MLSRSSDRKRIGWGTADALSSVLFDLKLTGTFFCNSSFGSRWALDIAERDFASFHFVAKGSAWLQTFENGRRGQAVLLRQGDLALIPRSPRQVFASERRTTGSPLDALPAKPFGASASVVEAGKQPARWQVICGGVRFEGFVTTTLVGLLPQVLVLRARRANRIIANALEAMRRESLSASPGGATLMTRLAEVILIHALRTWLESQKGPSGWIAALKDPQIGQALAAVHRRPETVWSLEGLARTAHLSRSRFSQRFAELTGEAPMQYVTKLRMQRAAEALRGERLSIGELALRFGYESEPAFARAFKRHLGKPPGAIRRQAALQTNG